MSSEQRPEVATMPPAVDLLAARREAAERYRRARPLLRQALSLAKTYLDDGAAITAYHVLLRACTTTLENEAAAGPGPWVKGLNAAPDLTAEETPNVR